MTSLIFLWKNGISVMSDKIKLVCAIFINVFDMIFSLCVQSGLMKYICCMGRVQ